MNQTWINILQQNHKITEDEQKLTNEISNKSKKYTKNKQTMDKGRIKKGPAMDQHIATKPNKN